MYSVVMVQHFQRGQIILTVMISLEHKETTVSGDGSFEGIAAILFCITLGITLYSVHLHIGVLRKIKQPELLLGQHHL